MSRFFVVIFISLAVFCFAEENEFPKKFTLNTGFDIPAIGLGTYGIRGTELANRVVDEALSAGYRLFDSAQLYQNEKDLGEAFKHLLIKHNLTRSDVFITTKFFPSVEYKTEADYEKLVRESLTNFQTDYIDLFLIHWPGVKGLPDDSEDVLKNRHEAWQALAKFQKNGLIRSIGVSNFVVKHLKELKKVSDIIPALNQVEWHLKSRDYDLLNYCKENNILLQAYSSLGSHNTTLRNDPIVSQIATDLGKSSSQVLLRWASQNGIAIIPKATSKKHLDENMSLNFVIPEIHMKTLNGFEQLVSLFNRNPNDII